MNKELQLLVITQQLWNEFVEAGFTHPDEANEVRHEIHGIQSIGYGEVHFERFRCGLRLYGCGAGVRTGHGTSVCRPAAGVCT